MSPTIRSHHDGQAARPPRLLAIGELGRLVREKREREDLSVRRAAEDAGVSFSTITRVEAGAQPDLGVFLQLCAWLGEDPARFFPATAVRSQDAVEQAMKHITADPRLTPDAAEAISSVVRTMYTALAAPETPSRPPIACHLRASSVLRPGVPEHLGELLRDMHSALELRLPTQ